MYICERFKCKCHNKPHSAPTTRVLHLRDSGSSFQFFRDVYLDVDYVDKVILPEVNLQDFEDSPVDVKERTIGVLDALKDAGIDLHFNEENCNQVRRVNTGMRVTVTVAIEAHTENNLKQCVRLRNRNVLNYI